MTDKTQLIDLMQELLEKNISLNKMEITERGFEIINEISDYAEQTRIYKENKEKGKMFDGLTAQKVFAYMCDRIINAPTAIHRDSSIVLLMPIVRRKLREENKKI